MKAVAFGGLLLTCVAASAFAATQAEFDTEFRQAMAQAAAGQSDHAIKRLTQLAAQTRAPRIRLELGRLLLRVGRNAEALELFRQIYLDPATPQTVKRNILPFIEEAELRIVRIRYGARIVSDTNPSKVGEGGTVYFNGIPLEYQPPASKKLAYGLEPWFSAEKLWQNGLLTKFNASARLFQDKDLTSGFLNVAVGKSIKAVPGLFVQASIGGELVRDASYLMPSIETWKRFAVSPRAGLGLGGQFGYMVSQNADISGPFYRAYVFGDWTFSRNATVFARLSAETLDSKNDYYDYVSAKADLGVVVSVASLEMTPKVSWKQTHFPQYNLFWGRKRQDVTVRAELTLASDRIEWKGIRPEISAFYEQRNSNVDIYDYDQVGGFVNFRKLF